MRKLREGMGDAENVKRLHRERKSKSTIPKIVFSGGFQFQRRGKEIIHGQQ